MIKIVVRKEFARIPGARSRDDGPASGEEFRETLLAPKLRLALESGEKLVVDMDGTAGFAASFLEEAFGGLLRESGFTIQEVERHLVVLSPEDPLVEQRIRRYVRAAAS